MQTSAIQMRNIFSNAYKKITRYVLMCESKIATRKSTYKFTKVYMNLAEKQ